MKLTHFKRNNWEKIYRNTKQCFKILTESEEDELINNIMQFEESEDARKLKTT